MEHAGNLCRRGQGSGIGIEINSASNGRSVEALFAEVPVKEVRMLGSWTVKGRKVITDDQDSIHRQESPANSAAIRSPACPSQSGGCLLASVCPSLRRAALTIASRRLSTSSLVPIVIVTGLSVFGRAVRQGIPRNVVSSWTPPESVNTSDALLSNAKKSK